MKVVKVVIPARPQPELQVEVERRASDTEGRLLALAVLEAAAQGKSVTNKDLRGANFGGMTVENVDLSGCDIRNAGFASAVLLNVKFKAALAAGVSFAGAILDGCDLSDLAEADEADFFQAKLTNTLFVAFTGTAVDFGESVVERCNFAEAAFDNPNLEGAKFSRCTFLKASLSQVKVEDKIEFEDCDFERLLIVSTVIAGAVFAGGGRVTNRVSLRDVAFRGGSLKGLTWPRSDFENVRMDGVEIEGLALTGASLDGLTFKDCAVERLDVCEASAGVVGFEGGRIGGLDARYASFKELAVRGCKDVVESDFCGADVGTLTVADSDLRNCDFSRVTAESTSVKGGSVEGCRFWGADLGAAEIDVALDGSGLEGAKYQADDAAVQP